MTTNSPPKGTKRFQAIGSGIVIGTTAMVVTIFATGQLSWLDSVHQSTGLFVLTWLVHCVTAGLLCVPLIRHLNRLIEE